LLQLINEERHANQMHFNISAQIWDQF
jgi:hypothetical protein